MKSEADIRRAFEQMTTIDERLTAFCDSPYLQNVQEFPELARIKLMHQQLILCLPIFYWVLDEVPKDWEPGPLQSSLEDWSSHASEWLDKLYERYAHGQEKGTQPNRR